MNGDRPIVWLGESLEDLSSFPLPVKQEIGFSLRRIQKGATPDNASPLPEWGAMEIKASHDGEAYRGVYVTKLGNDIYVLHCFHKKSTEGKNIPKRDTATLTARLAEAKRQARAKSQTKAKRSGNKGANFRAKG